MFNPYMAQMMSMNPAGGGAGALGGGGGFLAAASPWAMGASIGLSALGGIMGAKNQKKAKRANENRYKQILGLLQSQGSAAKQQVAVQEGEARAGMKTGLLQRGVTGSSAFDAAMNASREREHMARTSIDEGVADRIAGVMERRTDTAGGGNPMQGFASLAGSLGQYGANMDFQRKMLAMLQQGGNTNGGSAAVLARLLGG